MSVILHDARRGGWLLCHRNISLDGGGSMSRANASAKRTMMTNYRFYLIEFDGYLVGSTLVQCPTDTEALAKAEEIIQRRG